MADTPAQLLGLALKAAFHDWMHRTWGSPGVQVGDVILNSHEAVDKYNGLIGDGVAVGALIHSTC